MKWGILASVALVLVFVIVIVSAVRGKVDGPTAATTRGQLAIRTIPADLSKVHKPTSDASANEAYRAALDYFVSHREALVAEPPPKAQVLKLTELFITAMNAGSLSTPFLDDLLPMGLIEASDSPTNAALQWAPTLVLQGSEHFDEDKKPAKAREAALAVFVLGHRAFTHSTRLDIRHVSLFAMKEAGNRLFAMTKPNDPIRAEIEAFAGPLAQVDLQWNEKLKIVKNPKPHAGDLIHIAENDQDRSFRVAATRWLGVAKFNAGTKGNERGIREAIARAKSGSDPELKAAAEAAERFTAAELRRFR
jgi:hypothetical protein